MIHLLQIQNIDPAVKYLEAPVSGNCLAGAGIANGDRVAVALDRFPRVPKYANRDGYELHDFCLCQSLDKPGPLLIKQYNGVVFGQHHAGTRYAKRPGETVVDVAFPVKVLGVVFALWGRDGQEKWRLPLESFPQKDTKAETVLFRNGTPI